MKRLLPVLMGFAFLLNFSTGRTATYDWSRLDEIENTKKKILVEKAVIEVIAACLVYFLS